MTDSAPTGTNVLRGGTKSWAPSGLETYLFPTACSMPASYLPNLSLINACWAAFAVCIFELITALYRSHALRKSGMPPAPLNCPWSVTSLTCRRLDNTSISPRCALDMVEVSFATPACLLPDVGDRANHVAQYGWAANRGCQRYEDREKAARCVYIKFPRKASAVAKSMC